MPQNLTSQQPGKPILRYHYHIFVTATTALRNLFGGKIPLVTGKAQPLPSWEAMTASPPALERLGSVDIVIDLQDATSISM